MSKNRIVFLIGLLLLLLPFTGFPSAWKSFFYIIFGLVLVGVSFSVSLKRRGRTGGQKERAHPSRRETPIAPEKTEVEKIITPIPAVEETAQIEQEKPQSDVSAEVAKKEVSEI